MTTTTSLRPRQILDAAAKSAWLGAGRSTAPKAADRPDREFWHGSTADMLVPTPHSRCRWTVRLVQEDPDAACFDAYVFAALPQWRDGSAGDLVAEMRLNGLDADTITCLLATMITRVLGGQIRFANEHLAR